MIPTAINPEQALSILNNIISTARFPVHWAAIKMQVEVSHAGSLGVLEGDWGEEGGGGGAMKWPEWFVV